MNTSLTSSNGQDGEKYINFCWFIPVSIRYLHELDMYVEEYKAGFIRGNRINRKVNPEYARRNREVQRFMRQNRKAWDSLSETEKKEPAEELRRLRQKQREIPSEQFRDETYKNLQYVRYVDDFIISIIGAKRMQKP